jgi:hypothetical protein
MWPKVIVPNMVLSIVPDYMLFCWAALTLNVEEKIVGGNPVQPNVETIFSQNSIPFQIKVLLVFSVGIIYFLYIEVMIRKPKNSERFIF